MYEKFEVDKDIPYRLYFGSNKNVDWVDLITVRSDYDWEKILFEDLSPIIRIKEFAHFYFLEIDKLNSKWRFYFCDSFPQIRLIEPEIKEKNNIEGKIIFEYGKDLWKKIKE